ncbi:MAG: hypothetical protein ACKO5V_08350, partial [Actinomycetota bacterium]
MDKKTVLLPREVALHLRAGKIHRNLQIKQPSLEGKEISATKVDQAAIDSIATLLRLLSELMNFWAEETPTAIQSGGLGVRDLKKATEHLGVEEAFVAFLSESAYQLGILTIEADGRILPNANFDIFQSESAEEQWREIFSTWKQSSRVIGLIRRNDS